MQTFIFTAQNKVERPFAKKNAAMHFKTLKQISRQLFFYDQHSFRVVTLQYTHCYINRLVYKEWTRKNVARNQHFKVTGQVLEKIGKMLAR